MNDIEEGDALPVLRVVTARDCGDCGVCCLAMILGYSYEDIFAVAVGVTQNVEVHTAGMWIRQIVKIAEILGVTLHRRRKWDLETSCGILSLHNTKRNLGHVVVLKNGMIFDVDGTVWEASVYLENSAYAVKSLLTLT
jgi:ABC-type bacteriocin/lantibiotic exporter with double-glycine peptidase domain